LDDGKDGITDVVVEAWFKLFREAARKKVVTVGVAVFGAERAFGRF
jgi:hypothetical protein